MPDQKELENMGNSSLTAISVEKSSWLADVGFFREALRVGRH
jgi:hypothetical protein